MKTQQNKTMGLTVPVSVPDSIEEYDQLAGEKGAVLKDAIQYNLFHAWNSEFRTKFVEEVEKETGIERKLNQAAMDKATARKDGTKPNIYEQEGKYFARVLAEQGVEASSFQAIADRVAKDIKFDPSEGSRGGGKLGKEYLNAADQLLNLSEDKLARAIERLETANSITIQRNDDGSVDQEVLARAIKTNADRKRQEAMNELTGE